MQNFVCGPVARGKMVKKRDENAEMRRGKAALSRRAAASDVKGKGPAKISCHGEVEAI